MAGGTLIPLHEPDSRPTQPPDCGGPGFVCPGLEHVAVEIGLIRAHVMWQTEVMLLLAKKIGLTYPRPPSLHPKSG